MDYSGKYGDKKKTNQRTKLSIYILDNNYFIFPCHIVKLPPLVKKGGDVMLDFPPDLHPPPPKKHAIYLEKGKTIMALSKCIAISDGNR